MEQELSVLFEAIVNWAMQVKGAENVGAGGNLWRETTEASDFFPAPVTVTMNATAGEIDGIPPFSAMLTNDVYFPGVMAMVNPYGGTMIGAGDGDEDRLIKHFNCQPRHQTAVA